MKKILITGANRGIGLELCSQYNIDNNEIYAICRKSSKELKSLNINIYENIDITSGEKVIDLRRKLDNIKFDILINNAGIYEQNSLNNLDPESILKQFEINALSPLCFTKVFLNNIKEHGKIIFITSRMASIDDNTSGSSYGYRMSKVALSMAAKSLSIDIKEKNIYVGIIQ